MVTWSSAEVEHHAIAHTISEMLWVHSLLYEISTCGSSPMQMYCNIHTSIFIASNPVFHKRPKHIEVNYYFIRNLCMQKMIVHPSI